jgi:hypothetical protein
LHTIAVLADMGMTATPQIVVVLRPDGSVEDISVMATDHRDRLLGFHLIEVLTEEIEVFEARAKLRIKEIAKVN